VTAAAAVTAVPFGDFDEPAAGGRGYAPGVVCLLLRLVLEAGVSLRAAPRVLRAVGGALGVALPVPHWTTGRLWLLRLGHAVRTAPLAAAGDWAWLVDHSVQVGPDKCLVILGIRLADLPPHGQALRHADMELIELRPAARWTRADVDAALETAVGRAGAAPRVIVDDHAADLHGGVELFRRRHPGTAEVYDAKHKAACLLRGRLERDPRWQAFQTRVGQARNAVRQTELAFLAPPAPKLKARFMNLGPLLAWARRVLAVVRDPPPSVRRAVATPRLEETLGWVGDFASDLAEWSQWQQVVDVVVAGVNGRGLYNGAARRLARELATRPAPPDAPGASARRLAAELVKFVRSQERQARPGERFPGSTEVLESCFGKFKHLEKQQSRGGFTQLLLGFGALVADLATATVRQAMRASRTADVREWAARTLGTTLLTQRKQAFAGATEDG
jgi:hypothetical protein